MNAIQALKLTSNRTIKSAIIMAGLIALSLLASAQAGVTTTLLLATRNPNNSREHTNLRPSQGEDVVFWVRLVHEPANHTAYQPLPHQVLRAFGSRQAGNRKEAFSLVQSVSTGTDGWTEFRVPAPAQLTNNRGIPIGTAWVLVVNFEGAGNLNPAGNQPRLSVAIKP